VSLSIGIVEINETTRSTPEIVRAADTACYTAKQFGRNRVQLFDQDAAQNGKSARVFDFVKDIQTAIHGNRMELFYLPLEATPAVGAGAIAACELSVGIRNAAGEFLTRDELLDLASRYQLIEDIDRWAIKAAVDALRLNHPALCEMDLVIVPLSQQSMTDDRLLDFVTCLVREDPSVGPRLGFSFDEAGLVGHLEHVRFFVTTLKECGCRFMVGDLGFGAEGIDIIKSLQADFLGIRGRLVQNMLHSTVDYEVVLGLSRIARSLGMRTVAEDADNTSLREALGKMGIDYAKGVADTSARRVSIYSEAQWV
jgi:EAL domain-containing protein (putative c-di-GMP-specific phosphodiesterase class I)